MNYNNYKSDFYLNNFVFWGTDDFSVNAIETLFENKIIPKLIITVPDKPAGRGQKTKSSSLKIWAEEKNKQNFKIEIWQPEKLDENFLEKIKTMGLDYFIVASYGKIIPENILLSAKLGAINIHPSLLPLYRGPSPIETSILEDRKKTGVTIILMDEKMDHGPILERRILNIKEWPNKNDLEKQMAVMGAEMLVSLIPKWFKNDIVKKEQEHPDATFTKKIKKEDGLIEIKNLESRQTFLKIQALNPWPGAYFFIEHLNKKTRIKITKAEFVGGKTLIKKVIPEGKKEMTFEDFKKGFGFKF
jgi:methionyl-tRNA formyltransferase